MTKNDQPVEPFEYMVPEGTPDPNLSKEMYKMRLSLIKGQYDKKVDAIRTKFNTAAFFAYILATTVGGGGLWLANYERKKYQKLADFHRKEVTKGNKIIKELQEENRKLRQKKKVKKSEKDRVVAKVPSKKKDKTEQLQQQVKQFRTFVNKIMACDRANSAYHSKGKCVKMYLDRVNTDHKR